MEGKKTYKALQVQPDFTLKIEEVEFPQLTDDQVLVKMAAAPINPSDVGRSKGRYGVLLHTALVSKAPALSRKSVKSMKVDSRSEIESPWSTMGSMALGPSTPLLPEIRYFPSTQTTHLKKLAHTSSILQQCY